MPAADNFASRAVFVAALGIGLAPSVEALAGESPFVYLRQITHITTGTIFYPKMRSQEGNEIAFVATADVMGPGTATTRRQVYLWRSADGITGTVTQVTNGANCDSYDVTRPTDTVLSERPEVIAFVSTCDLDPLRDNSDGNPEIFYWEVETGKFHQITNTPSTVVNAEPFVSDSGKCLVFRSNGDLDNNTPSNPFYDTEHPGPGYSNPDKSSEIFLYGKINQTGDFPYNAVFTQASNGPAGTTSSHPVIGGYYFPRQCQTTAFQSDYNQLGTGVTGQLIWTYNKPGSVIEEMKADEIPNGWVSGIYRNPMISSASPVARGPHVIFEGVPDLWNNGSGGVNAYNWRALHPRLTQYTNVGPGAVITEPQIADGGGILTYGSTGELLSQKRAARNGALPPFNADGNSEIFRQRGRRRVAQLTQTTGCQNLHSSIQDDAKRLAFISTCDLIPGHNSTAKPQIFVWSRERDQSPLRAPGACVQSEGCCYDTPAGSSCYGLIEGKKPKVSRPNCVERDACN